MSVAFAAFAVPIAQPRAFGLAGAPGGAHAFAGALRIAAMLCAAAGLLAGAPARPEVRGLDHVPVAVSNLEQAKIDFERLGFVIKPGRHHNDGIRNAHIKFADHTEIELITASVPVDRLTSEYVTFLKDGDGPESFSLYSPNLVALTARLTALNLSPNGDGEIVTFSQADFAHHLFFADREPSPTDRPEFFAHPNGAYHLQAVYFVGSAAERRLLLALGASPQAASACVPFATSVGALTFADGTVFTITPTAKSPAARSIVGALLLVRDIRRVRAILQQRHVEQISFPGCAPETIWVAPSQAHGLWLGFRQ